jgi:ABC-type nitrate/sulfonate/bicarbonate transport system permease component
VVEEHQGRKLPSQCAVITSDTIDHATLSLTIDANLSTLLYAQMWLIIGFIFAVILAIIIGVAVSYSKSAKAAANNN